MYGFSFSKTEGKPAGENSEPTDYGGSFILASTAICEVIAKPTQNDILCGKEKQCLRHPGSRRFREVIESYHERYRNTNRKGDKMNLTKEILAALSRSSARFLKFNNEANGWEELTEIAARDKISHALRNFRVISRKGIIRRHLHRSTSVSTGLNSLSRNSVQSITNKSSSPGEEVGRQKLKGDSFQSRAFPAPANDALRNSESSCRKIKKQHHRSKSDSTYLTTNHVSQNNFLRASSASPPVGEQEQHSDHSFQRVPVHVAGGGDLCESVETVPFDLRWNNNLRQYSLKSATLSQDEELVDDSKQHQPSPSDARYRNDNGEKSFEPFPFNLLLENLSDESLVGNLTDF